MAHGLSCPTACGILVPCPGIKPKLSAVEALSLNHWTAREFPPVTSCNSGYVGFSAFKKINLFVYLFAVLGLHCCESISLVVVCGFLICMAFLAVKHLP